MTPFYPRGRGRLREAGGHTAVSGRATLDLSLPTCCPSRDAHTGVRVTVPQPPACASSPGHLLDLDCFLCSF